MLISLQDRAETFQSINEDIRLDWEAIIEFLKVNRAWVFLDIKLLPSGEADIKLTHHKVEEAGTPVDKARWLFGAWPSTKTKLTQLNAEKSPIGK